MSQILINARQIRRDFTMGAKVLPVLHGIDFQVGDGEFVAIMGPSGSGKSTLLHILGCLEHPTSGTYHLDGVDVSHATDSELSHIRVKEIGFIFQTFNLLSELNVQENVSLPFLYNPEPVIDEEQRVNRAIHQVGLEERISHRPAELSGGEKQRVAIARAMAIEPKIILADEPTGNLDSKTGRGILELMQSLHGRGGTIVMVTHDREVASHAQRIVTIKDGRIADDTDETGQDH